MSLIRMGKLAYPAMGLVYIVLKTLLFLGLIDLETQIFYSCFTQNSAGGLRNLRSIVVLIIVKY